MGWRPDNWDELFKAVGLPRGLIEAGADTMHQADMDYLRAREYSVDYSHKGYIRVTYNFTREDWKSFKGEEAKSEG